MAKSPSVIKASSDPRAREAACEQALNEGLALYQAGKRPEAAAAFRRALAIDDRHSSIHSNLGAVLTELGQVDDAIVSCRRAIALDPNNSQAYNNLGTALAKADRHEEAITALSRAIELQPNNPGTMSHLATCLAHMGRLDEAETMARRAIVMKPQGPKGYSNLGIVLQSKGRLAEAATAFRQAVALAPDLAVAHKNLGLALLHEEQYVEGWREYEWRWKADQLTPRSYPKPMWQGGPVAGKTVLVFAEQGLGDAIHFARFATVLAQAGARVVLEAHPPLVRLMSRLQGVAQVMPLNGTPPAFDCFQALMSVPGILGVNATNIPVGAYLTAEPERVAAWRARIGAHGFKVGIVWQGKGTTPSERARSTAIQSFAPLAAIPGVRLISLQKQSDAGDVDLARIPVETLGADFDSGPDAFLDTAAVMASLDLVVTIDTSIAHLAGALGRPVWIALKHVPDWRWTMHGTGSRWYPNARLFRQPTVGDWSTPFNEIAATLGAVTKRVAS